MFNLKNSTIFPQIKICGLRTLEDIEIVNKYDIQYAGFIFAEESKRKLTPEFAKHIRENLRNDIKAVGVFTHTDINKVNYIANYCNLDIIQLHSNETYFDCKKANRAVWKSIAIENEKSLINIEDYTCVDGILFDTYKKGISGGSGEIFNWNIIKGLSYKYFTIVAGGLSEENINDAIKEVSPHVVDICSGVETGNFKDENKIKNLIRRVQNGIK